MFKRATLFAPLLLCACLLNDAAASVLFTGAGTWDATAPTTTFSAPGARWSFDFLLPDRIGGNATSLPAGFTYALNGVVVGTPPGSVEFFNALDSGMFDLNVSAATLSFYGPTVWTGSAFLLGSYVVDSGLSGGLPIGSGTIRLQAVPEPAMWAVLLLGAGLAALASRGRRRRDGAAALASSPRGGGSMA